ncbi:MAG: metallophosphoesterase [Desulfarculus sp.]|nr:metallophosphoesterase [Desulfarculus sp.]
MPERVIRWLHLSDFHCGKGSGVTSASKSLFEEIEKRCNQGYCPDLVFLTGDIANKGQAKEYNEFRDVFYDPLEKLLTGRHVNIFVVPGNHDLNREKSIDEIKPKRNFFDENPGVLEPNTESHKAREKLFSRFEAFTNAKLPPDEGKWLFSKEGAWAKIIEVQTVRVGILLINTAWVSRKKDEKGQLSPGRYIVEEGLRAIEDAELKLVVGHHPLPWFHGDDEEYIRQWFGDKDVLYVHGHLHHGESRMEEAGSSSFRVLQTGAVFEPTPTERLKSRVMWAELNLDAGCVITEPLYRVGTAWVSDNAAFHKKFQMPDRIHWRLPLPGRVMEPLAPKGWKVITPDFLQQQKKDISDEEALKFFNGLQPNWALALSEHAPRRGVVAKLKNYLLGPGGAGGPLRGSLPSVTLLSGPSGEGKSTILRQTVAELLKAQPQIKVFWHDDLETELPMNFVEGLDSAGGPYLIVSDEADLIVQSLHKAAKWLHGANHGHVHFLLSVRSTSWIATNPERLRWRDFTTFNDKDFVVSGLTLEDARELVKAWRKMGDAGLCQLKDRTDDEAARTLVAEAAKVKPGAEGSFLGALLEIREGPEALRARVGALLAILRDREFKPGVSLADAFAYIAAPHDVGILVLTKPVLAQALGCTVQQVGTALLTPLGQEALIAAPGRFITTRHQKIAKAACELLREQFGADMDEVYVDLIRAATEIRQQGPLPEIKEWNRLPAIFAKKRPDFALRLIQAQRQAAPNDKFYLSKHSALLRGAGDKEGAARLFRSYRPLPHNDRAFFFEWASAEGEAGRDAIAAWLTAYSLADAGGRDTIDNTRAKQSLAGLGMAFLKLHEATGDHDYALALGAVGQLGPEIDPSDYKGLGFFQTHRDKAADAGVGKQPAAQAWQAIEHAIKKAWAAREEDLPDIPPASGFKYNQLLKLLGLPQVAPA